MCFLQKLLGGVTSGPDHWMNDGCCSKTSYQLTFLVVKKYLKTGSILWASRNIIPNKKLIFTFVYATSIQYKQYNDVLF